MSYTINTDRNREKWVRQVSPIGDRIWRWDLPVDATVNSSSVDPESAYPLIYGEFLQINAAGDAVRGADPTTAECVNLAAADVVDLNAAYMMFAEQGRTDLQVRGGVPLLTLGSYIMETKLFHSTSAFAVDDDLYVGNVAHPNGGGVYQVRGLVPLSLGGNPGTTPSIGRVIKTPATNGGWLQFLWNLT